MRCADRSLAARLVAPVLAILLAACGGNSSETTTTGGGPIVLDTPTGPNTTEIVIDTGPAAGFSFGVANVPYVTVTVCAPGSATACVTIDHVFLDTGSYGLRILKSKVASLALAPIAVPANAASNTPAGRALECYPFVLGAVWGPLASADVRIGGELASSLPVQLIDDATPMSDAAPAACIAAANGGLQNSVSKLQANAILGVGLVAIDCGIGCRDGNYSSGYTLYYSCSSGSACTPAAIPLALQVQNPVAHFAVNNNGTMIAMPAVPDFGATLVKGRLVFGIGTQTNNQIPPSAKMLFVDANPADAGYLYFPTTSGATTYPNSYIDSGSNAFFFDDASLSKACKSSSAAGAGWYCPSTLQRRTATLTDTFGTTAAVDYSVADADVLFQSSNVAFAGLAGSAGQGASTFVWGMPFFYGRTVFTSIWGQNLSLNGPWNAF